MRIHCDCAESCEFFRRHGHCRDSRVREQLERYCTDPDGYVECVRRLVLRIYGTHLDCQVDPDGQLVGA